MGRVDAAFMDLPTEVLSTSMCSHQKYFSTETPDGRLGDRFLVVANMEAPAGSERAKTIVAGNERVLRARLADARFFWDQDRKQPLSARVPALKEIVFHAKLGTLADKISRRSEEHTSELQSLMRISYAVFCLNNKSSKEEKKQ